MEKRYGLSFPKSNKGHQIGQITTIKPSIFGEDSDEEVQTLPTGIAKGKNKQDKLEQKKAIEDDPTVYQYDELYDDIEKKRSESKLARKDLDKKPKYISKLLAAADKRKKENDRRIERQVQKEREEEGDLFKDKESFITPSYKKKLEEMKELEEQEKREEYLESIGDVKKQGNLDGFYRHLYEQKVNYTDQDIEKSVELKEEPSNESSKDSRIKQEKTEELPKQTRKRKYRSRKDSGDNSVSEEEPEVKKEHLPSNIDADSDFSINSSDSEEENKSEEPNKSKDTGALSLEKSDLINENEEKPPEEKIDMKKEEVEVKHKPPKVDIWKKRTVGEKFDEAVKKYFERKALKEMGPQLILV